MPMRVNRSCETFDEIDVLYETVPFAHLQGGATLWKYFHLNLIRDDSTWLTH